ncbi:hypothetical protein [Actinomadura sp. HBU206391]|uniref:hypothetical protein n=1 Tax=Actinomadura sp. HBU206391 TaxID=2731692 RepID=UPI00165036FE|nr:hypothetical protein [Actinomadura sp. HBU206391]MBC6458408.1 hypothetical protein [Actinomadura sp. HBU206391]
MAASSGRKGRPWRRICAEMLAESTLCDICGHLGASQIHHDPPRSRLLELQLDPEDRQYLRRAHGGGIRCEDCGRNCNQMAGTTEGFVIVEGSRDW